MAQATSNFDIALAPFGEAVAPKSGFFGRFLAALIESRYRAAEREVRRHSHLINEINALADHPSDVTRDQLPF